MKHRISRAAAAAAWLATSAGPALATDDEVERLRAELAATRAAFENHVKQLEARIGQLEAARPDAPAGERLAVVESRLDAVEAVASAPPPAADSGAGFNPQMSLILGGSWNNLSDDPADYALQGFVPAGEEGGPGERGFGIGESELTLSASIDPLWSGQATFAITPENEVEVEEAFVRTGALPAGATATIGRFFSNIGYVNAQHAHAWDFVDAPLAYQAFFGGNYKNDGVQLSWLAPLDIYLELGAELGNGHAFPGNDEGNGVGAYTLYAATGADIGASASWKAGISYLHADAVGREWEEADAVTADAFNPTAFSGSSQTIGTYLVYKWSPDGNSRDTSFKLQGEFFRRIEDGRIDQDNATLGAASAGYHPRQNGWYLQGIYKFLPNWRAGLRHDRLDSGGNPLSGFTHGLGVADLPGLAAFDAERTSLMLDWSPSEFSRIRLQYARDHHAPGEQDDVIYLQYLMSLGAHGAHQF